MKPFDKYHYYLESVQDPAHTADFIENTFRRKFKKWPRTLREDFCGAFALCTEWIQRGSDYRAIGLDRSSEPLNYGKKNYLSHLPPEVQKQMQVVKGDVLKTKLPKAQVIAALNFSYFIFKKRTVLVDYFKRCYQSLDREGMFLLDCFGGPETHGKVEDVSSMGGFTYYWDQTHFDPITHYAKFYIHYKRRGEKKRERVFTYDWRMWSIPEIRDALADAGFKETVVFWEGTLADGSGDGNYQAAKGTNEECNAWVVYIAAFR